MRRLSRGNKVAKAMGKAARGATAKVGKVGKADMDRAAREVTVEGREAIIKVIKVKAAKVMVNPAKEVDMAKGTTGRIKGKANTGTISPAVVGDTVLILDQIVGDSRATRSLDSLMVHPVDHDIVVQNAQQQAGGSGDPSLFGSAMGYVKHNQSQHTQPIDEENVQVAHAEAYQKGNASSLDAGSLGSAAAMQVLKQFTSGGASGGSGNTQSQLIALAMAEASKLFDSQGSSSGQKQDAVNGAAMTIMKLLVQSKMGGATTTGGGNSGGLGSLMSLASQFAK
ncbi:hypothetical protein FRC08_008505 [Ceratobasidium sp. 394]|nr:hypothetical protein FRC08_008505 [Ceratobasidium sp. 394]